MAVDVSIYGRADAVSRKRLPLWRLAIAVMCPLLIVVAATPSLSEASSGQVSKDWPLFGARSLRFTDLSTFEKWTDVLQRYAIVQDNKSCSKANPLGCFDEIKRLSQRDAIEGNRKSQLIAVNAFVNQTPYQSDIENWQTADYWATPNEFLGRSGDCEDFAITKYFLLRTLGWESDELRITAVINMISGTGHAVLIAHLGDTQWILDNETNGIVDSRDVNHYRPLFSLNETAWWQYQRI